MFSKREKIKKKKSKSDLKAIEVESNEFFFLLIPNFVDRVMNQTQVAQYAYIFINIYQRSNYPCEFPPSPPALQTSAIISNRRIETKPGPNLPIRRALTRSNKQVRIIKWRGKLINNSISFSSARETAV